MILKIAKKLETSSWFWFAAVLFRLMLELGYIVFINPIFEDEGYGHNFRLNKYIESWIIFIIIIYKSPKILTRPSDYLVNYLNFSFLCPLLIFYALSNAHRHVLYILLLGVALIFFCRGGKTINFPIISSGNKIAYFILTAGVFIVTVWMLYSGGLGYFNLDMELVYEYRDDAGDLIDKGIMSYLNVWASKVFGPVLLALALWKRKYFLAVIIIGLHIFWFGVSSHKAIIFYPFLVIFLWSWFSRSSALSLIPLGMSLVIFLSLFAFYFFDEIFLGSMFIRRVFFVPAKLTFDYYEFFSNNPLVYWSSSITSSFIEYPYLLNTALVIGEYLGSSATAANNSFLSTGYMHAGIPGVILYGVMVGFLFKIIDSLALKKIPVWLAVSIVIVPSQALLTSADLPTALLTHGFGISLIILFLMKFKNLNSRTR